MPPTPSPPSGPARWGLMVVLSLVAALPAALPAAPPATARSAGTTPAATAPTYAPTPCPFTTDPLPFKVACGLLTVPERRADPAARPIALHVTTVRSPNPDPDALPLLYLSGGPGEGAIAALFPTLASERGEWLMRGRDLIVLDQRGTGYSVPALRCDLFTPDRLADEARAVAAARACHDRHAAAGIDLAGYTTAESAADAADLRRALGLPAWDVYGVSYGTRVALTLLRDHPAGVRALVLDSPSPPQSNVFRDDPRFKLRALEGVFARCAAEPACAAEHPDLGARFGALVEALNAQPLDLDGTPLTGDFLVFVLTNTAVFGPETIPVLPGLIEAALAGDPAPLAELFAAAGEGVGFETDTWAAADGALLAVHCAEDAHALDPAGADLAETAARGPIGAALARVYGRLLAGCAAWDQPPPAPGATDPVRSDVPTLVLVGEEDPATPPELAEETLRTLPNGRAVLFPGAGHAILDRAPTSCPHDLLAAFLADPDATLDTACVARDYAPVSFADVP